MSHQNYHTLTTKDVVVVEGLANSSGMFQTAATLRVKDLLAKLEAICTASGQITIEEMRLLFGNGMHCEVLRPGAEDWQVGQLKLNFGFEASPDAKATMPGISIPIATTPKTVEPIAAPEVKAEPSSAAAVSAAPANVAPVSEPTSEPMSEPAAATAKADISPEAELELSQFDNAIDAIESPFDEPISGADIDSSDIFSLMGDEAIESDGSGLSFEEALESISSMELEDASPLPKVLSSPWDMEDLDSMLTVK